MMQVATVSAVSSLPHPCLVLSKISASSSCALSALSLTTHCLSEAILSCSRNSCFARSLCSRSFSDETSCTPNTGCCASGSITDKGVGFSRIYMTKTESGCTSAMVGGRRSAPLVSKTVQGKGKEQL